MSHTSKEQIETEMIVSYFKYKFEELFPGFTDTFIGVSENNHSNDNSKIIRVHLKVDWMNSSNLNLMESLFSISGNLISKDEYIYEFEKATILATIRENKLLSVI